MTISKILIANRGEIALRIIRTCKEMGIKTVALYPRGVDKWQFLETRFADESYCMEEDGILGYLDQGKIIQIAKMAKADAIHPGYGFLSENGAFSELCQKNGIKFIGSQLDTLRKLGDKIEAKKIAKAVKCPLLPGTESPLKSDEECWDNARRIDPPFILKAANGGGGMGIEVIEERNRNRIIETFHKLKREVKNAFGSDEIFIEKFLRRPRHIEVQILGDGKGRVVHFGERECSIQRRHQKLVEEAPAPLLDRRIRDKMLEVAVKIGEYMRYESLGTVEFLLDEDKEFYFLEVNPRIQVEHPITEIIAGVDLVAQQIRIAGGEELKIRQKDIIFSGSAIEFRINAEDALNNFHPYAGQIEEYLAPMGKGIEMHTFCQTGQIIYPFFDSLIAKMVVFGKNRNQAIRRAKRAFSEIIIEGVPTLIPFFRTLISSPAFQEAKISTSFIKEENIIEKLKEEFPQGEKKIFKTCKPLDEKDIAFFVASIYQEMKGTEKDKDVSNKWKTSIRPACNTLPATMTAIRLSGWRSNAGRHGAWKRF